ncbi:MAG: murein biosynthesis integral membrane protein MurJ [Candidatus Omnitrophota bacterium]
MMENRKMIRSAGVVGGFTMLSRIMGFIRDIIFARLFGTGMAMEAFVVAFKIPNLLRDLAGEGAANAAVVPVLSEYLLKHKRAEFWRLVNVVFNIFVIVLAILAFLGVILAPLFVRIIAFGFVANPAKLTLTVQLTRILFPFIFFIGLTAYAMAILNTFKHFILPAFGPVILNICIILFGLFVCPRLASPIFGIATAVLIGGVLQLLMQLPVLYKKGWRIAKTFELYHPAAKRIGMLLVPRMVGASIYQVNILINTMLASLSTVVGAGAVAALYFANRMIQLPFAIFGLAIATVSLPTMSDQAAVKEINELKNTTIFALKVIFALVLPSATGLMVLAGPIIKTVFEHGQFSAYSTAISAQALFFYCFGLVSYGSSRVLASCFYALQDTKTPVKFSAWALLVNIILGIVLMWPLKIGGLALATSISATLNVSLLYQRLNRRLGGFIHKDILFFALKIIFASAIMGVVAYIFYHRILTIDFLVMRLGLVIGMAIVVYFAVCRLLGIREVSEGIKCFLIKRP